MPTTSDEEPDYAERIAAHADVTKEAWQGTLDDMRALTEEYEQRGWHVVDIAAGNTAPKAPEVGEDERFGLVHVIPGNKADPFREAVARGEFPKYDVLRGEVQGSVFLLTALLDPASETAILIAGQFEVHQAQELISAAKEDGVMYTHVQKLDKTQLGSFRHDEPEKFFPEAAFTSIE